MVRSRLLLAIIFRALRVYVAIERPFRAFARWWRGAGPDVVLEPLTLPDGEVPEVRDATPVFISASGQEAYAPAANGKTLRRVGQDEKTGELVYLRKPTKQDRRALKRAKRNDGRRANQTGA